MSGEKEDYVNELSKRILNAREQGKKETIIVTWIVAIIFFALLLIFILLVVQPGKPEWEKDIDRKTATMSNGQLLQFAQSLYIDKDMSDYYGYVAKKYNIVCEHTDTDNVSCSFTR